MLKEEREIDIKRKGKEYGREVIRKYKRERKVMEGERERETEMN